MVNATLLEQSVTEENITDSGKGIAESRQGMTFKRFLFMKNKR
jgi:hypothetical protein